MDSERVHNERVPTQIQLPTPLRHPVQVHQHSEEHCIGDVDDSVDLEQVLLNRDGWHSSCTERGQKRVLVHLRLCRRRQRVPVCRMLRSMTRMSDWLIELELDLGLEVVESVVGGNNLRQSI